MSEDLRKGTVCFIVKDGKVLLALIEYGPNDRKWNGLGGWAEEGESIEDAVVREIKEETYLEVDKNSLKKVHELYDTRQLNVFTATNWTGEVKARERSIKELQWFNVKDLPFDQMLPGTDKWLPRALYGMT